LQGAQRGRSSDVMNGDAKSCLLDELRDAQEATVVSVQSSTVRCRRVVAFV